MASLIAKKKGRQLYYYVAESARVDGKPRIVRQTYLGSAEKVAALLRDRTAPVPVSASSLDFGLPGALWLAAQQTGLFALLESLWPQPRSGPSTAHYLLLAAFHRICQPGPKTTVPDWYRHTILHSLWQFDPDRFSSQAFWDCFDRIRTDSEDSQLDQAQSRLLQLWNQKQLVSQRLLAYDTTNFFTFIASTNDRVSLARRGHNKQGRHNLRQVAMSYVLDGEQGISLCHHVYPGNVSDSDELPQALSRILALLDRNQIARDSVTLVFDKGSAALANTLALEEAGVGWISALPWNQAPEQFRERDCEQLPALSSQHPGMRAAAESLLVHGKQYLCVVSYSASFAAEQLHSLATALAKASQNLRRLSVELAKPRERFTELGIRTKIRRWLSSDSLLEGLIRYTIQRNNNRWHLQFDLDGQAFARLMAHRLGRTTLVTNRTEWTAEQVVAGYAGQQRIEQVFRGLKDGEWLGWGPMYHWTDSKIKVHAFYCMLGISLLQYLHKQANTVWPGLSMEGLIEQLSQIQQYLLLYPPLGDKGPNRLAKVISKQTLQQQALAVLFGLENLTSKELG